MTRYLTPEDLTEELGLSKTIVYKLIKQKNFPYIRIGNKYLIPEDELDAYLHSYIGKEFDFKK